MKKLLTIAFTFFFFFTHAQYKESRKINSLKGISVSSSIKAEYIVSDRNEVVVESTSKDNFKLVDTEVKNGVLTVRYKPNAKIFSKQTSRVTIYSTGALETIRTTSSASLTFTQPINSSVVNIAATSSSSISFKEVHASKIAMNVTSSAKVAGSVETPQLNISTTSSGKVTLSGIADKVEIGMTSSAKIEAKDLQILSADVNGTSSASAYLSVSDRLTGALTSSSKIHSYGVVKSQNVKLSSSGKVVQL